MNITLRTHQCIAFSLCGLIVGCAMAFALMYAGHALGQAMKQRAKADVVIAQSEQRTAELKATAAYLHLEALRTDVEKANRKVAMAEYRLQKACQKLKGRC